MPKYELHCEACNEDTARLLSREEAKGGVACKRCNGRLARRPQGINSSAVEILDNGLMPKKIERLANIEEIMSQRARKDHK